MPHYVDPSWGFGDRQKAASIVCDKMLEGASFEEAWIDAEKSIYAALGIFRKATGIP